EHRAQPLVCNADPHAGCSARSGDFDDPVVDREQLACAANHRLAFGRERHAGRALVEQLAPEQDLQTLDLRADCRLSHAEALRRLGEAAKLDDRDQGSQQFGRNVRHGVRRRLPTRSGPRHRADGFSPTRSGPFPIREKFRNFCGGMQELARIPPWRRNAQKTAAEGAENRLYSGAQLFRERAAAPGLSNTITLDTKALRSRAWTRPQAEPIAPKSSSR